MGKRRSLWSKSPESSYSIYIYNRSKWIVFLVENRNCNSKRNFSDIIFLWATGKKNTYSLDSKNVPKRMKILRGIRTRYYFPSRDKN